MRLFIAAPLPEFVLAALQTQQAHYNLEGVRLVPAQNLHLTLYFLGETPATTLPDLTRKLQEIALYQKAFTLMFQEIAPGPKLKSPRLVWARFYANNEFNMLSRKIQAALGVPPDPQAEYIPHITIARLKKDKPKNLALPLIQEIQFPPYLVNRFSIWQSELGSPHPSYRIIEDFELPQATN